MIELLQYPLNDKDWIKKNLIGGLLSLTSLLAIPAFFLLGYQLRAMEHGLDETPGLPEFKNWWNLFKTGFSGTFIVVFYALIGIPIYQLHRLRTTPDEEFFTLLATGITIVFVYFLPAALANYLRAGKFRAGFYFQEIADVALQRHYGVNWLIGMAVLVVGSVLTQALKLILVGFILEFYLMVALFHFFGRTIRPLRADTKVREH